MEMKEQSSIGVCVPTSRPESARIFLEKWASLFDGLLDSRHRILLFIHEDLEQPALDGLDKLKAASVVHTSRLDIPKVLGAREWIIPRQTGACRSFPMYLAWKEGCEFILTLDDDCYPGPEGVAQFIENHIGAFNLDCWFRTIDGVEPRGFPYGDRGRLQVLLNHGLWTGVPDLDAPTFLTRERIPVSVVLRGRREVIPPGQWFSLSAINVCYSRRAIPAAYNLLMGRAYGFDRFDDVWSGLFLKKIADHLGFYITSGLPFVRHSKASDPFVNLCKEGLGIHLHEYFWRYISAVSLKGAGSIAEAYRYLAEAVSSFPTLCPSAPCPPSYFETLSKAMMCWLELFSDSEAPSTPPDVTEGKKA
jgi:hypothetical protein